MGTETEEAAAIEAALLESGNISRVIALEIFDGEGEMLVCAKLDLPAEISMREVSTILFQAKRRVEAAVPAVTGVYLEPDVWVDPKSAPTTSSVVMLGLD